MGGFGGYNEKKNKKKKQGQVKFSSGGVPTSGGLGKPVFKLPGLVGEDQSKDK